MHSPRQPSRKEEKRINTLTSLSFLPATSITKANWKPKGKGALLIWSLASASWETELVREEKGLDQSGRTDGDMGRLADCVNCGTETGVGLEDLCAQRCTHTDIHTDTHTYTMTAKARSSENGFI